MAITNTTINISNTTIYTAASESAITTIFFCNKSAGNNATLDVFAVPSGGSATSSTQILKSLSIPATETFVFDLEKLVLSTGDTIQAAASINNAVVATVSAMTL